MTPHIFAPAPNLTPDQRRSLASKKAWRSRKRMAAARSETPKCSRCGPVNVIRPEPPIYLLAIIHKMLER